MHPLILDLDGSVGELPGALRYALAEWHEPLRFACSMRRLRAFASALDAALPERHGSVFFGSGDFHHLSLALIGRAARRAVNPLRVVVFDNHPDNMRFPFGVHCGSWVSRVAALPQVARVDVAGITSSDIGLAHAWENRLAPLYRGRLRYWSIGVDTGWAARAGLADAFRNFDSAAAMLSALLDDLGAVPAPLYLSIDKDVLDPVDARSNWDQGVLRVAELAAAIHALRPHIAASDINGEVSVARYRQRWKRVLSAFDGQPLPDPSALKTWQAQQHAVNLVLLQALQPG